MFYYDKLRSLSNDNAELGYPKTFEELGQHDFVLCPALIDLVKGFVWDYVHNRSVIGADPFAIPDIPNPDVRVFHSLSVSFYSSSDESGMRGMRREHVRCTPNWFNRGERRDTILIHTDPTKEGFDRMDVGRVKVLFSFEYLGKRRPCALIEWFKKYGSHPDPLTKMWRVVPEKDIAIGRRKLSVVPIGSIVHGVHLEPDFGRLTSEFPHNFDYRLALNTFTAYFVNRFADGHLHELLSK